MDEACTERILNKLDDLAREVSDLRVQVAKLEARIETPKSGLVRDGGITLSGGAVGAIVTALIGHFVK